MMGNNGEKRTHRCNADDCGKHFMISHYKKLKKAIGNYSNFGCAILEFENITTWQYMHAVLSLGQSKDIIFTGTIFPTLNYRVGQILATVIREKHFDFGLIGT